MSWKNKTTIAKRSWSHCQFQHELTNSCFFDKNPLLNESYFQSQLNQLQCIKDDKSTTVAIANTYVIKRFNARSFAHKVKRAFRKSRAKRCWQMSFVFSNFGLKVARPELMYEVRLGPIRRTSFYISQKIVGEELLSCLPSMDEEQQIRVIGKLSRAFFIMRKYKISHGDLKASNLIWDGKDIYFIDLDVAKRHRCYWTWARAAQRDKKRFLKNWKANPNLLLKFSWLNK